jgi:glycosyltransferase involved in cell wall biosynthesis
VLKVLFINSGNSKDFDIPPFIKAQGTSLIEKGISVDYFRVQGKGLKGYLRSISELRKYLKQNTFDLIHAHYVLSGWVAVLTFSGVPVVLSLMGTDAYGEYIGKNKIHLKSRFVTVLTYLIQPFVNAIISKSRQIESYVYRKKISSVIPNGISLEFFKHYPREIRKELGLKSNKQYVLFLGEVAYKRKNFELAENAVRLLKNMDVELVAPYPVSHEMVVKYLNASDVLIMTAFIEGSSNVIKEAMACNCPIVATDVGDVKWVLGETEGTYIASFDPEDVAAKIKLALHFSNEKGRTKGRQRILDLGLDSSTVAKKIIEVYEKVLAKPF